MQTAEQGINYQYKHDQVTFEITEIKEDVATIKYDDGETGQLSVEIINDSLGNGDLVSLGKIGPEEDPPTPEVTEDEEPEEKVEEKEEVEEETVSLITSERPYRAIGTDKLKTNLERYRDSLRAETDIEFRTKIEATMDKIEKELTKRF